MLLARQKMSGAELGRRAGIKQSSISRRLTGETAFDMDDLEAIADVLGVEVGDLLPKSVGAGRTLKAGKGTAGRSADPTPAAPAPHGPFSGGRRDSARPVSAIPATRRRPQLISSAKRPRTR